MPGCALLASSVPVTLESVGAPAPLAPAVPRVDSSLAWWQAPSRRSRPATLRALSIMRCPVRRRPRPARRGGVRPAHRAPGLVYGSCDDALETSAHGIKGDQSGSDASVGVDNLALVVAADVDGEQPGVVGVRVVAARTGSPGRSAPRSGSRPCCCCVSSRSSLPSGRMMPMWNSPPLIISERDQVAARRPGRAAVAAVAEADPLRAPAAAVHDVELGRPPRSELNTIRPPSGEKEGEVSMAALSVSRLARRLAMSQSVDVGVAALRQGEQEAAPVGREARGEGHAREVAEHALAAAVDVVDEMRGGPLR